jgi:hypothetical protein
VCTSYTEAENVLRKWSRTAPQTGGYDKCDFEIHFEDGSVYKGRYDLTYCDSCDIAGHVLDFLMFHSGQKCPSHLTKERYENYLALMERETPGTSKEAADFIVNYQLKD